MFPVDRYSSLDRRVGCLSSDNSRTCSRGWRQWICYFSKFLQIRIPELTFELRRGSMKEKWGLSIAFRFSGYDHFSVFQEPFSQIKFIKVSIKGVFKFQKKENWYCISIPLFQYYHSWRGCAGRDLGGGLSSAWVRWPSSVRQKRWGILNAQALLRQGEKILIFRKFPISLTGWDWSWQHFGEGKRVEDWGDSEMGGESWQCWSEMRVN